MPRCADGRTSRIRGAKGCKSSNLLLGATSTTIAMSKDERSCWYDKLRSAVMNTSNNPTASASSSPFRLLAHPISGAVLASWPTSSRFRRLGRHSSSRTRTSEESLLGLLQGCYGLLPGDGREVLQELGQGLPCLQVIEQR